MKVEQAAQAVVLPKTMEPALAAWRLGGSGGWRAALAAAGGVGGDGIGGDGGAADGGEAAPAVLLETLTAAQAATGSEGGAGGNSGDIIATGGDAVSSMA